MSSILLQVRGKLVTAERILQWVRRYWNDYRHPLNGYRGVYETFADAERAAPRFKPLGYDAAGSANWFQDKQNAVRLDDYPVLYWLRSVLAAR